MKVLTLDELEETYKRWESEDAAAQQPVADVPAVPGDDGGE